MGAVETGAAADAVDPPAPEGAGPGPAAGELSPGAGSSRWRQGVRITARRAPVIVGLAGIAITQPVLDLFGNAPEFFVAGRMEGISLVWFALAVGLLPAILAITVIGLAELADPRLGATAHLAGVGGFSFVFGLVLTNHLGIHGLLTSLLVALALAGLVVWLERRFSQARSLLSYVALGNLVFLGMFLFSSPASDLLTTSDRAEAAELAWVDAPPLRGPVVVLVLDELPVTTLMRPDGTINEARYPNFARLADRSTWFRNASSQVPMTHQAMPSLLTGMLPENGALPTFEDYPQNFFTMFGDTYPVNGYESVTHLCPGNACATSSRGSLATALKDAAVVFGHQTLPTALRERLPDVDQSWGNFGDAGGADGVPDTASADAAITEEDPYGRWHAMDLADTSARNQIQLLDQVVAEIDDRPSLHLAHVAVPHYPWVLAPEGELTQTLQLDRNPPDPDHELLVEQAYQLQSLQIGAVDRSVGALMDRLEAEGAWDDALVVVTSDHGRAMQPPPNFGRVLNQRTREEMLRVPLFVKAPGQTTGEVRDDVAQLVDIMPSMLDLLGADSDHRFDGHSLFDGSDAEVAPQVDPDVEAAFEVAADRAELFPHGEDWLGLAGVGEQGDLVGTAVSDHRVGPASGWRVSFADQEVFADLPAEGDRWPRLLLATLTGGDTRPPDLVVAVDGQLAGILSVYERDGGAWTMTGVTGPAFHEGASEVVAYEVERTDGDVVLHPLSGP